MKGRKIKLIAGLLVLWGSIPSLSHAEDYKISVVRYPFTVPVVWKSDPPKSNPFPQSKDFSAICFTGNFATYTTADTWYPSWAEDGNLYSPWTDGQFGHLFIWSGGETNATTGQAKVVGDNPTCLKVYNLDGVKASALPYGGRYPSANLVYNGIWYYGTYAVQTRNSIWDRMGPFVGFRISRDYGKTWEVPHKDVSDPLFKESSGVEKGNVKIGSPHFVDFGKNMEYSPDGKAYLVAHGSADPNGDCSWCSGDEIYLLRVTPSPETINDMSAYEYFAGYDKKGEPLWTNDFDKMKPLLTWKNNSGIVNAAYNPYLKKYLMCITYGGPGGGPQAEYDSYILESEKITGPWKMITYMRGFGPQGYFLNFPTKFMSKDGKRMWLCYATNWTSKSSPGNPAGGRYSFSLQEIQLMTKKEERAFHPMPTPEDPITSKNNIARKAKVTVSSEAPDYEARAAIDGVVDGFFPTPNAEWASNEGVDAWIRLSWKEPQKIQEIWLFDRPLLEDTHILDGELRFSDGTTIKTGPLPNEGKWIARTVTFPTKRVDWVEFRVLEYKGQYSGLAEFAVFQKPVPVPEKDKGLCLGEAGESTVSK